MTPGDKRFEIDLDFDAWCDAYENLCRRGEPIDPVDFAARYDRAEDPHFLLELIAIEVEYQVRRDQRPVQVDSYLRRFSGIEFLPCQLDELIELIRQANARLESSTTATPKSHSRDTLPSRHPNQHDVPEMAPPPLPENLGRYCLLRQIGEGSFSTVWRAMDESLDREVAIKIPHPDHFGRNDLRRIQAESRTAAMVRHPNIVSVFDFGFEHGICFLVQELVDGPSLAEYLGDQRPDLNQAIEWTIEICDALQVAHERGIVHRDLKPANILLRTDDQHELHPMVSDFGFARQDGSDATISLDGRLLGTPAYMAPEQAVGAGNLADRRSDLYSTGVILYEMLTGKRPFEGSIGMILEQVIREPVASPRKFNRKIGRDLETICLKCLAKHPSKRYQTAHELSDDLRRLQKRQPIRARPVPIRHRAWLWCQRNRSVASLGSLLILTFLVSTFLLTAAWRGSVATTQRLRWEAYVSDLVLAQRALDNSNASAAREFLTRQIPTDGRPDLRRFDWYYLWEACHRFRHRIQAVSQPHSLAVVEPGERFAIASADQVEFYRLVDGSYVRDGLIDQQTSSMVVAGGERLLFTLQDHDRVVRRELANLSRHSEVTLPSPTTVMDRCEATGMLAIGMTDGRIRVLDYDLQSQRDFRLPSRRASAAVRLDPSGRLLAAATEEGEIVVWDLGTGDAKQQWNDSLGAPRLLAWTPAGDRLLSAGRSSHYKLWNVQDGSLIGQRRRGNSWIQAIEISPDGETVLINDHQGAVEQWDLRTGQLKDTYFGHSVEVSLLAGYKDANGRSYLLSADTTGEIYDIELTPSPQVQHLSDQRATVKSVAFSPDGRWLATAGYERTIEMRSTDQLHRSVELSGHLGDILNLCFSSNGRQLASASKDGTIRLWNFRGNRWASGRVLSSGSEHFISVAYVSDHALIGGTQDGHLIAWDRKSKMHPIVVDAHDSATFSLHFSPEKDLLASVGRDGWLRLWRVAVGTSNSPQPTISLVAERRVADLPLFGVRFSPDGDRIATSASNGRIHLWDVDSLQLLGVLRGHSSFVNVTDFSPDGKLLATGSWDGTVKLWDMRTLRETVTLAVEGEKSNAVAFSIDGKQMVSVNSHAPVVTLWQIQSDCTPSTIE